jgi:hypothetical protein
MHHANPLASFVLAVAATLLPTPPAAAQSPVPGGTFQMLPHQAGSGTALLRRGSGERSARRLAQQSLQMLAAGLDRPPRTLGGMVSQEDNAAMLSFAGHQRGVLVQGYLVAQISPQGYTVAVALDEPQRLARSGPALLAAADAATGGGRAAGPSPYANLKWNRVPFGTGTLDLPLGWQIVGAGNGAVDVVGPGGEVLGLGAATQVMTPQAAQQFAVTGMAPQMFVAPAMQDPMAAFQAVQPQIERFNASMGAPVVRLTRVIEADRIPFPGMTAALIASEGVGSMGNRPYRKLALVAAGGVMANGNWLYYTSEVYAPTELYPHALPVMLKIWNSWTVDKKVLMERLISASKSMRDTQDILNSTEANRQQSQDRLSTAWGHHLRGTVVVADTDRGRQSTEWLYQPGPAAAGVGTEHNRHMNDVVRDANQAAGYARWQIVNP